MKAVNEYRLPVRKVDVVKVDRVTSPGHRGKFKNSVDFLFTDKIGDYSIEGKPIYAAADGEVVHIKDDSQEGGSDIKKYSGKGNGVLIKHVNDEFSYYEHLKYKGAVVKKGDKVKTGDLVGYSGNTGFTLLSHFHFHVLRFVGPGKYNFKALEVKFKELGETERPFDELWLKKPKR